MKKKATRMLLSMAVLLMAASGITQTGTFDFESYTGGGVGASIFQTVDGVTMTLSVNDATVMGVASGGTPSGMSGNFFAPLQYPGAIYTFTFSAPVNISTIRVQEMGPPGTYSFTPNAGSTVNQYVDASGATVNLNFTGITSFTLSGSTNIIADNIVMDASLSVGLSAFSAHQEGASVLLNWVTESECDNAGYILERRSEGAQWQTVASYETHAGLMGQGNTSERTEYTFVDEDAVCGTGYDYRLSDVNRAGAVTVLDVIAITLDLLPAQTMLKPAYPNPFNPSTKIQYELAEEVNVTLGVVDVLGRHVQTIVPGETKGAGVYSIHWNGCTEDGLSAPSGVYFLVMRAGDAVETQKVMLVR